jgi:hypothetical protein
MALCTPLSGRIFSCRPPRHHSSFHQNKIAEDRSGRRATRVAQTLNSELERFWKSLADGKSTAFDNSYEEARRRARTLGFDFIDNSQLITQPPERILRCSDVMNISIVFYTAQTWLLTDSVAIT